MTKPDLIVQGMHGLGDNIHQRAVLRQLMQTHSVTLETSWASVYHDLVGDDLKLVRRPVGLRTQTKNAQREAGLFSNSKPQNANTVRIRYGGANVMQTASKTVLEAMCQSAGVSYANADYRLPVLAKWLDDAALKIVGSKVEGKPLLVYRPLVARTEWRGSMARNADPDSYAEIYEMLRPHFFVVSIADLVPGKEWIVGPEVDADLKFHNGELTFEDLAALFRAADLVLTSSGFAAILAPAVETNCISVIGGYEGIKCHSSGARFAPHLTIGPEVPCQCWSSSCRQACDKTLNMGAATAAVINFVEEHMPHVPTISRRVLSEKRIQISDKPAPGRATVMTAPPPRGTQAYSLWLQQTRHMARNGGGQKA